MDAVVNLIFKETNASPQGGLAFRVWQAVHEHILRRTKLALGIYALLAVVGILGVGLLTLSLGQEIASSGVLSYLSFLDDAQDVAIYAKDILFAVFEAIPGLAVTLFFAALFVLSLVTFKTLTTFRQLVHLKRG